MEPREKGRNPAKSWRCFHCDKVFNDEKEAAEHFGSDRDNPRPAQCASLLSAIADTFEQYGIHRSYHNAASVHLLANKYKEENGRLCERIKELEGAYTNVLDACGVQAKLISELEQQLAETRRETFLYAIKVLANTATVQGELEVARWLRRIEERMRREPGWLEPLRGKDLA